MSRFIDTMVILSAVILSVVLLGGCKSTHYEIEITPDGKNFERKLTCWRETHQDKKIRINQLPKEELERIGKLYDRKETPADTGKQTFVGRFGDTTPADVGGAGEYTHFTSRLGTVSSYVERFRGNDDLDSQLAKRRAAADQLVDLLLGWLEREVGNRDGFGRLKKFVDEDFRRDLKNLGIYLWTGGAANVTGTKDALARFGTRMGQYLCERNYFKPKDIPALVRVFADEDSDRLVELVKRTIARRMGVADDQPLPECLTALGDWEQASKSFDEYIETTDEFKSHVAQWQEEKKNGSDAKKPSPSEVTQDLLFDAVLKLDPSNGERLTLKLHCDAEPFATNGEWDEKAATVSWSDDLRRSSTLPVVCFAMWSCPLKEVQTKHFGKVVLDGNSLAEYVIWYRGLSPDEMRQWDGLIASCEPGKKLTKTIEQFRFADDPKPDPAKPDEKPASLADTPRGLIMEELKEKDRRPSEKQAAAS